MELTNELKAKFFALYWEQEVYSHCTWNGLSSDTGRIVNENAFIHIDGARLMLKPLSSISDEDAIEIMYLVDGKDWVDKLENKVEWGRSFVEKYQKGHLTYKAHQIMTDWFRFNGFAVEWMGISVEQMIEAGWIKLINQTQTS